MSRKSLGEIRALKTDYTTHFRLTRTKKPVKIWALKIKPGPMRAAGLAGQPVI